MQGQRFCSTIGQDHRVDSLTVGSCRMGSMAAKCLRSCFPICSVLETMLGS